MGKVESVVVFTGKNCPGCEQAKKVFTEKGIPFETLDLIENLSVAREYSFRSVPSFVVKTEDDKEIILVGKAAIDTIARMFEGKND